MKIIVIDCSNIDPETGKPVETIIEVPDPEPVGG